jgi:hypothetical protein
MSVVDVSDAPTPSLAPIAKERAAPKSTRWQWVLSFAGVVGIVVLVRSLPRANWAALLARLGPAFPLLAAIALGWMALYARGLRVVLDDAVDWARLVRNRVVGDAYNVVMPLGDLGGDPFRIADLADAVGTTNAVRAIVFDRLVYVTGGLISSGLCTAAAVRAFAWDGRLEGLLTGYAAVALGTAVVVFVVTTRPATARWIERGLRFVKAPVPKLPAALPMRTFARALGWNLLARAGVLVEIGVLLLALGQHVRLDAVVAITAIISVAGIVFTFVPNGIGVNEGAAVLALTLTGYGESVGLAVGLARRARQLLLAAAGVALHTLRRRRA